MELIYSFCIVAPFLFIFQTNWWNTGSIRNGGVQLYTCNFYALVSGMDVPTIQNCNISL